MGDAVYAFNVTATVLTVIEGRQDQRITGIVVLVVFQLALLNKQTTNTGMYSLSIALRRANSNILSTNINRARFGALVHTRSTNKGS